MAESVITARYAALTHANLPRGALGTNEDALLAAAAVQQGQRTVAGQLSLDEPRLFAVSDGAHAAPRAADASRILLTLLQQLFECEPNRPPGAKLTALQAAYSGQLTRDRKLRGMTATLVAVELRESRALLYHVGDSRAWLVRNGIASRLTRDHTVLETMIDDGEVDADAADNLASVYHALDRYFVALPDEEKPAHDQRTLQLEEGDLLLLASDGLTLDARAIADAIQPDLRRTVRALFRRAVAAGSDDNVTVLAVELR